MSYGIDRVPADVDPTAEALANLEALEHQPRRPVETRSLLRCDSCGQRGYTGDYPFSTLPDSGQCDDCL